MIFILVEQVNKSIFITPQYNSTLSVMLTTLDSTFFLCGEMVMALHSL